ncbi:uncharacterized protein LOC142349954 isoform X2 [Convolutriloba macropyga]|uniref:uncharacterized protein LOC142349954 isoform X2 n=1 Tax=Convolutriloba macropyga TaxID=536237 RepID=UPI003F523D88
MDKFCRTFECDGAEVDKKTLSAFQSKVKLGFLMKKASSMSSKSLIAFRDEGEGKYSMLFKSAKSGIAAISNSLGPFTLNGGAQDLVWKRPDGEKFYTVFTLSEDGNSLVQTLTHLDNKIPVQTQTRTLSQGSDGELSVMTVIQECDGISYSQTFNFTDFI